MTIIEKALMIAVENHRGQTDKSGKPYIEHVLRVYSQCETDEQKTVAVLHDIIEDTNVELKDLINEGFDLVVIKAVDSITKKDGELYDDYLTRVAENKIARYVKIRDLQDNMNIMRLKEIKEKDLLRLNKYVYAFKYLTAKS